MKLIKVFYNAVLLNDIAKNVFHGSVVVDALQGGDQLQFFSDCVQFFIT